MTLWTVARQAPLSTGVSRQKYWSGLPCPPPGDLPDPGIEPESPALQVDSLPTELPGKSSDTVIYFYKSNDIVCVLFSPRSLYFSIGLFSYSSDDNTTVPEF